MFPLSAWLLLLAVAASSEAVTFTFKNNRGDTVWPAVLANDGKPTPDGGGWELPAGSSRSVDVEADWAGRFWARTNCNFDADGQGSCETGDCGKGLKCDGADGTPPYTLAEVTLNGPGQLDYYDINLVNGYNVGITMAPSDRGGCSERYQCNPAPCTADLQSFCPEELQLSGAGGVVACKSACLAFNTDQYCCRGAFGTAATCQADDWPENYASYFKTACPDAFSYAFDDQDSTFVCKNTGYTITFS